MQTSEDKWGIWELLCIVRILSCKKELEWFQTMLPDLANATIEAFHFSSLSICRKEVSMSRISFSPLEPDAVKITQISDNHQNHPPK